MESIFLSYQYTGEDPDYLGEYLRSIKESLAKKDREVFYCFEKEESFRKKNMSLQESFHYCLKKQRNSDIYVAIVGSEYPSENIALELELAQSLKQNRILFIKKGLDLAELRHKSTLIYEFADLPKLYDLIDRLIW